MNIPFSVPSTVYSFVFCSLSYVLCPSIHRRHCEEAVSWPTWQSLFYSKCLALPFMAGLCFFTIGYAKYFPRHNLRILIKTCPRSSHVVSLSNPREIKSCPAIFTTSQLPFVLTDIFSVFTIIGRINDSLTSWFEQGVEK